MSTTPTKFESLLKALATKPMNNTEIRNWLASRSAGYQSFEQTRLYDFSLYGTAERVGILERFTRQNNDGRYQTIRKVVGPFTPVRYGPSDDTTVSNRIRF
jgi:hypothetical protein